MITPFGLRHSLLLRYLQSDSTVIDLSDKLTEPVAPLRAALRGYFLGTRSGIFTYVLQTSDHETGRGTCHSAGLLAPRSARLRGFAQAWANRSGVVWSVVRMAPALENSEDAPTIWYRLLLHLCIAAGEQGAQRLFARLPEDSPAEDVFRQASFTVYTHEQVFSWRFRPVSSRPLGAGRLTTCLRLLQAEDLWDAQRLYRKVTPRLVLQVEEPSDLGRNAESVEVSPATVPPLSWLANAERGYALYDHNGQMLGYLGVLEGSRGSWLHLMVHPDAPDAATEMLDHALAVVGNNPARPLYCAVREYQGGMQAPLEERGFSLVDNHSLLVKHTTARVKEPVRKPVHALEKRAEIAPTVSRSKAEGR